MWNKNYDGFIGCDTPWEVARLVLLGAPYDSTSSNRPGSRFASRAMRGESWGMELYSPYQDKELTQAAAFDGGDLELPFGDSETALDLIEEAVGRIFDAGKRPVLIGGEHLVALGSIRAAVKRHPGLHIIHFDAHTDLREEYLGVTLSHATVLRRAWELVGDGHIHQFGIRSGDKSEFNFARAHTDLHPFDLNALAPVLAGLQGQKVYFTLDLDVLDPSVFPGTGTQEPGGVSFRQLLEAIKAVGQLDVVGVDVCELSPALDPSGASTALACVTLRELLLAL